ncbi:sensor histidine kinase [Lunatibacter salilacus]|uniref:sensor histidine kinase n=1 Tax=Lunatibacter salilacus TaxID=2483804 RepID=UPI00131BA367|nr:sensor histidine kinase [Lunatibacter salilacus]
MMRVLAILFYLFAMLTLPLVAQQRDFVFRNVTIHQGLSQNSVVDIEEDPAGFMWFATQDGLNRFDGREFQSFPKYFDDITTSKQLQLGKIAASGHDLWFVSKGGILEVLDLLSNTFRKVTHLGEEQVPIPFVSDLFFDKEGNLWIGTLNDGVFYYDRKANTVSRFGTNDVDNAGLSSNQIRSIYQDRQENIWILTPSGLNRIENGRIKQYLEETDTNVATEDNTGRLWVGTLRSGLFFKEAGANEFRQFEGFENYPIAKDLIVEAIHADQENNLWVGTYGKGLYVIQLNYTSFVNLMPDIRNPYSIGFQDILTIHEDSNGGIWVGTDGGGVSYYRKQFNNFRRITDQNVSSGISIEQIRAITTDADGQVWIGTSGQGLTLYQPASRTFETVRFPPLHSNIGNPDRVVSLLTDKDGDLWVGTQENGLVIRNRVTKEIARWFSLESPRKQDRIPDNTIWCMMENEAGQIWVGTRNAGLLLLDKDKGLLKSYMPSLNQPMQDENSIRSILQINDSTLAIGFEKVHGVQMFHIGTGEFSPLKFSSSEEMIPDGAGIKDLYYEDGWLWIATAGNGLVCVQLDGNGAISLKEENGLPNNTVYGILPENDSTIWASGNRGLFRLTYTLGEENIEISQISIYSIADGLQSTEFNTGAFHMSKTGTMYFGGISGLNYFDPKELVFSDDSLNVVLTGVMVGNRPVESDTIITYNNHLSLNYFENSLSFNYTGLDFVAPDKRRFFYQLKGYDRDWVDAGSRRYTAYTNLLPGDYEFMVKSSMSPDENAPITSLSVSIAFPFWLEWWFTSTLIVVIILFIYGVYRYRINQLLYVQQVKNNISADLHDEIGSRLTSIQLIAAIFKNNMNGKQPKVYLEKIENEVQMSAEALDEIVWNINITDESLAEIVARMRRYASEVLESDEISYKVEISADFAKKKMSMQKRRELFLIFKELLNNIRKHAQAKQVHIQIYTKDQGLCLAVTDHGVGFDPSEESDRNGLRNIRYRLGKWGGKMDISSEINKGTTVCVWVPFERSSITRFLNYKKTFSRKGFGRNSP